ncbi:MULTISPECIES: sulfite exporter TauE/SafE family protein [unclassified Massilia]|uniref:sulfite exporter TauE/SafE family protein n=1 Tax=unclassified Massilia TaxID=2609279 RepID=UPI00178225C4|nr:MULTISPECIES: sulfite exporter TauE/SafE family protein [unclassified Massilia]MBD8529742.1 sulfite exporter TauE/SafE family protein [Massilia sp. CFBP 13647]MBD8672246.1 sulfite exporter TauE/SafE family protein [Massilia sp. CFBP 13721]
MDPLLILALLAMGAFGGFAAGLLGIGGGMILVPFITMILTARGVPEALVVHMAIATSLATIMFTSLSSVRAHHKHGAVVWRIVALLAPGIVVGSTIGPWIGKQMNASTLAWFFGAFVAFSATQMLVNKKPAAARDLPGSGGMFAAGGVIGVLAGLVGAGGGFVSVPFMTWCGVRIHNAVATSAALGFPIALAGTLANVFYGWGELGLPDYSLGFIYLPALLIIVLASVVTAPLGARTAHRMPVRQLQKVFAVILYALAAYMFWKAM